MGCLCPFIKKREALKEKLAKEKEQRAQERVRQDGL